MNKFTIIGCGTWGSALAQILAKNGQKVTMWHYRADLLATLAKTRKHPNLNSFTYDYNIEFDVNIDSAVSGARGLLVAVPSHAVREIAKLICPILDKNTIIINVAKGVENKSLLTMSEVILEEFKLSNNSVVSLYGPSHAEEVIASHPTTLVAASVSDSSSKYVQSIFSSDSLRVYVNNDIRGVELGGSLKNIIAIATGICDGVGFGDNTKAALLTRGMAEITRLGVAMGAKKSTFSGLSGIGDLIATCLSRHSRNRYVGEAIGKGKSLDVVLKEMQMVAEGVRTAKSVFDLAIKYKIDMPISISVYNILFEKLNPKQAVVDLMSRDLKEERN